MLASPPVAMPKPPAAPLPRGRVAWPNVVLAATVLLFGAGGAAYVVNNERHLRARVEGGRK